VQRTGFVSCLAVSLLGAAVVANAQQPSSAPATDVYHVHFAKAVPGQAAALLEQLKKPAADAPMPGHSIVLRHRAGDDWDYCVIQHLGTNATVKVTTPPPDDVIAMTAWHTDTFAAGPAWPEFARAMAIGADAAGGAGSVYELAVWRAVPGQRAQLRSVLTRPPATGAKVQPAQLLLAHLEGGPWNFLAITRYNSWQDYATDEEANTPGKGQDGWNEARKFAVHHIDTLADRVAVR
jgi:hypothetical protein